MLTRERYLSPSAGPGKSAGGTNSTTPPDFDEAFFVAALSHTADELRQDEQISREPEFQTQIDSSIARVLEFFAGVDITTPAPKEAPRIIKNGVIDIVVFDFPFEGARVARASANGFKLAEIRTYDSAIGMRPVYQRWPEASPEEAYELHGLVGHDKDIPADVYITSYKDGMTILTDLDYWNVKNRRSVRHKVGNPPYIPDIWIEENHPIPHLSRPLEVSVLQELGVAFQPPK